jgi:hypothetical protein
MKLPRFDPPGFLNEFTEPQKALWSKFISRRTNQCIAGPSGGVAHDSPRSQYYNPVETDTADDKQTLVITWTAFPKNVQINTSSDEERWALADQSRDVQDEYCEWSVTRDPQTKKITRVTFTSEGPEYWEFLAQFNPDLLLSLYRQHVSPDVKPQQLFDSQGNYNDRNIWNNSTTNGAMHLVQRANTLRAEIELAAAATIVRLNEDGTEKTGEQDLITCSGYGDENRNSDPHIGGQVNSLARLKADVTISNPVALHIDDLNTVGWETPDGSEAKDYWKVVRGTPELALRAVFEVPKEKGFTVGDIKINGTNIDFGAQIADFITIKIVGQACRFGKSKTAPQTACKELLPQDEDSFDPVEDFEQRLGRESRR